MKLGLQSGTQEQIQQVANIVEKVVAELQTEKRIVPIEYDRFNINFRVDCKLSCQVCNPIKSCAEDGAICEECWAWLLESKP